jgi:hypothetical protein
MVAAVAVATAVAERTPRQRIEGHRLAVRGEPLESWPQGLERLKT